MDIKNVTYTVVPYEGELLETATIIDDNGRTWTLKDCHLDCVGDEVPGGGYRASSLIQALVILREGLFIDLDISRSEGE